jgi:tripartite-type tricarboxylate transporter receptor subunit TctC
MRIRALIGSAVVGLNLLAGGTAIAQSFPTKTAKIVVGFQPGGTIDIVGRLLAEHLTGKFGQTFVVENRPGATQMIAAEYVARSAPDGHTIFICSSGAITMNPTLFKNLKYSPEKDFAPVSTIIDSPLILAINPNNPATASVKNFADFINLIKMRSGDVTYSTAGNGNLTHVAGEAIAQRAGGKMIAVHYAGGAPSLTALLSKEVMMNLATPVAIPQMRGGELRALAVTTPERSPALPEVPTMTELGYSDLGITFWTGVFVPKATPVSTVEILNREIQAFVKLPGVREKLLPQGAIVTQSPADFAAKIRNETKMLADIVSAAGIKADWQ